MIIYILIFLGIIGLDQFTKMFAFEHLRGNEGHVLIKDFLELGYVENRGAAFGILQGRSVLFIVITLAVCSFLVYYFKTHYTGLSPLHRLTLILIVSGAIGNLIDRIMRGFVIDFIFVRFWGYYDFPLFNVADIAVVVGAIGMMILLIVTGELKE